MNRKLQFGLRWLFILMLVAIGVFAWYREHRRALQAEERIVELEQKLEKWLEIERRIEDLTQPHFYAGD